VESGRYSRRRQVSHDLSGFIGEVTFKGELASFLPYLKLGEYLHVGKNAIFGKGWYEIAEIENCRKERRGHTKEFDLSPLEQLELFERLELFVRRLTLTLEL
jgi:hypothetical protein